jgi:preprotein translocase SecE subunit
MTDNAVEEKDTNEEAGRTAGKGRATPGRRNRVEEKEEGNVVVRSAGGIREYFSDVRSELEKVAWPEREDVLRLMRVVLVVLVVFSLVMGAISYLFSQYIAFGLANPAAFVVLLAIVLAVAVWWFRTHDAPRRNY